MPVSAAASGNLFAEGILDILPDHRFLGLSQVARGLVLAAGAIGVAGLGVVTPLAYLVPSVFGGDPEVVLAWSMSAACTAGATASLAALRYWKTRADWSERLRKLVILFLLNLFKY